MNRICKTCNRPFQPGVNGLVDQCDRCAYTVRDQNGDILFFANPAALALAAILALTLLVILWGAL